ncbi:MAG: ammonium transporter [Acidiferrobacterales bacterium]
METTQQFLDVAWILVCAALVMLMQAGFSCLESGLVRSKNSINVAAKNFADFCLSSAIFWLFGFAFMFGATYGGVFGTSGFFFDETANPWLMAFFIFQLGFCGTATTIVSGAVAERMQFTGYLVIATILSAVIYPIIGHWVWGSAGGATPGGWLEGMGFIDFAGSTVVHSVGGWIALAAIIIIGPRIGRFGKNAVPIHGHDIPIVTLGVFLLWFGWFGFNGGSTLGLTPEVPTIIVNTTISGAFGGLVALGLSWRMTGRPDVTMIMNGSLAGLVGITASAHIMAPWAAVSIGCIAGVVMYGVTELLERLELDDVVGAVPVHLGAGIWGTLAVAIFGDPEALGTGLGRWEQLMVQATGVGAGFVWAFGVGFILLWLFNRWYPLRIDPEGERIGLNVAEHGASTEILDLLTEMDTQRSTSDFSQPVSVEPHTEIGQIAQQYNRVLVDINAEQQRREAATEALKQRTASLWLLRRAAVAANKATTIEQAMQTCLENICSFGGWPVGHCYMVDEGTGELVSTKIWHLDDPERFKVFREITEAHRFTSGPGLAGNTLATGKPTWMVDVTQDPTFRRAKLAKDIGVKTGFAFPVLVGEHVVAVLEFFSTEAADPNEAMVEVMTAVGNTLGRVVERGRSEAVRFKTVLDHIPAMVYLRDLDGRFVLINRRYEEIHGVTNDGVRGKKLDEVFPKAEAEEYAKLDAEVIRKRQIVEREETPALREKTRNHAFDVVKFPVFDLAGEIVALGGINIDVTERKRAREKLEEAYEIIRDQKERMEDELNIGREIQMSMLPLVFPPFPDHDEFSIYAVLEPAREVGGDFYDFFFIDDERFCICIGDVSGKGVPSALFMAVTKTLIKSRTTDDFSTASILTHVNTELSTDNKSCMFVTIFLGILNIRTGQLIYTNAGHNPPYLKRKDGSLQRLDTRHGPVIGAMSGMVYEEEADTLGPGDLLFMYTDGVTEEMNVDEQLFSEQTMAKLLMSDKGSSVEAMVRDTVSAVNRFRGETEQSDDITVLALRFQADPARDSTAILHMVVKNDLAEIANVNAKFEKFAKEHNLPGVVGQKMGVIFDELLNNTISYAFRDDAEHEIDIRAERAGNRLTITISDDGIPFNPLGIQTPDTRLSLEEREVGGLGIHLVRNMVDNISYQRGINRNVLSLVMHT